MVEHQLPKLAFAGSIPVSRSKQKICRGIRRGFLFVGETNACERLLSK